MKETKQMIKPIIPKKILPSRKILQQISKQAKKTMPLAAAVGIIVGRCSAINSPSVKASIMGLCVSQGQALIMIEETAKDRLMIKEEPKLAGQQVRCHNGLIIDEKREATGRILIPKNDETNEQTNEQFIEVKGPRFPFEAYRGR